MRLARPRASRPFLLARWAGEHRQATSVPRLASKSWRRRPTAATISLRFFTRRSDGLTKRPATWRRSRGKATSERSFPFPTRSARRPRRPWWRRDDGGRHLRSPALLRLAVWVLRVRRDDGRLVARRVPSRARF